MSNGGFTIRPSVRSSVTLKHVACYYNFHFAENHRLTCLGLPIIEWDSKCTVPSVIPFVPVSLVSVLPKQFLNILQAVGGVLDYFVLLRSQY